MLHKDNILYIAGLVYGIVLHPVIMVSTTITCEIKSSF